MTHDTWCGVNILSKFQLSSSNGLGFMMLLISGGKGCLNQLINQSISDEAVCKTAPATPGLLIMLPIINHMVASESLFQTIKRA